MSVPCIGRFSINNHLETKFRLLVNCFERPVEFQVPANNEWELVLDSYGYVLGPISWEKPGSVWVEGFSAKVLKIQSR